MTEAFGGSAYFQALQELNMHEAGCATMKQFRINLTYDTGGITYTAMLQENAGFDPNSAIPLWKNVRPLEVIRKDDGSVEVVLSQDIPQKFLLAGYVPDFLQGGMP